METPSLDLGGKIEIVFFFFYIVTVSTLSSEPGSIAIRNRCGFFVAPPGLVEYFPVSCGLLDKVALTVQLLRQRRHEAPLLM